MEGYYVNVMDAHLDEATGGEYDTEAEARAAARKWLEAIREDGALAHDYGIVGGSVEVIVPGGEARVNHYYSTRDLRGPFRKR